MFMHGGGAGSQPGARPFLIGTVLLLLWLSISTDWAPHRKAQEIHAAGRGGAEAPAPAPEDGRRTSLHEQAPAPAPQRQRRDSLNEQIIYELSVASERLERENAALRQHVLDLRRGARAAGRDLNASATFLPIPGLEELLANGTAASAAASRAAADAGGAAEGTDSAAAAAGGGGSGGAAGASTAAGGGRRRSRRRQVLGVAAAEEPRGRKQLASGLRADGSDVTRLLGRRGLRRQRLGQSSRSTWRPPELV